MRLGRVLVCAIAGGGAAWLAMEFEDALNNPLGFVLLVAGPLALGALAALPRPHRQEIAANAFAVAVIAAVVLGLRVAARDQEGGPIVVLVTASVAFIAMAVPLFVFAVAASMRAR